MDDRLSQPALSVTSRTQHRRLREQGRTERQDLLDILAAGRICHLGVIVDGSPMVVPTAYGYTDTDIYVHGSVASRSLLEAPAETVCVTITLLDGVVLARSVFEHGVNYRCAMIYGVPQVVSEPEEKCRALRALTEHIAPGQWDYARRPSRKELAATTLLAIPLAEASVKTRVGPPDDADSPDVELGLWAGVLPLRTAWDPPQPDPALSPEIAMPAHIADIRRS